MALAERIQGAPRTRKHHYPEKKDPNKSADPLKDAIFPFAPRRPKPESLAERFRDPIVRVNVQTGAVEIDRIREYWIEGC